MIFITGYPRSGTTFLSNQISKRFEKKIGPETQFYRNIASELTGEDRSDLSLLSNDKRLSDYFFSENQIEDCYKKGFKDGSGLLKKLLMCYSSDLIEKSPAHILYWENILSDYPEAKFVFIEKSPQDVINSNLNVFWTHNNALLHAVDWCIYYDYYNNLKLKYPDSVFKVCFESLIENVDFELDKVGEFLNFSENSVSLSREKSTVSAIDTVPDWEKSWKNDSKLPPDISKINKWKTQSGIVNFFRNGIVGLVTYKYTNVDGNGILLCISSSLNIILKKMVLIHRGNQ